MKRELLRKQLRMMEVAGVLILGAGSSVSTRHFYLLAVI